MTKIFSLLSILLLCSCVGTVQDAKQNFSKINDPTVSPIAFTGVTSAVPISDSRIEVFFYPATGGSGKYTYDVIVGSAPYPISIPSDVMKPDYRGLLKYTLTGLDRLTSYAIKVEVRDRETEAQSNSQVVMTATTFDNLVADFNGISSASNMPGQDGKDSIKIRWTPARASGGLTKKEWDPKSYEIIIVDAERLTPNDMDVTGYGPAEGRWVYGLNHDSAINEFIVRGLLSETKYYIRMRAIHEASVDDVYSPRKRSELNTNYITIATLSGDLADIDFEADSFAVTLAPGEQGLNAVDASWDGASGVFDHYRLYYSQEGGGAAAGLLPDLCLSPLLSDPTETVFCKRVDFLSSSSPITGLLPYTGYEVVLVLCATSACESHERIISPVREIVTDPSMPVFNGLREIAGAGTLDDLGSLYLKYDPPNFTVGYFDGLILKMRRTADGSDPEVEITIASSPEFHNNYNFILDSQIVVKGIDYLADEPYCFTLYPFKWDTDGVTRRESPNDVWKCVSPKPEAPTDEQFAGLGAGQVETGVVTLSWDAPSTGIFSHYELFWRQQSGQLFNWGDAISQAGNNFNFANYGRMLIDPEQTSVVLNTFADGEYTFGMVTYYTYVTDNGQVIMRSDTNNSLIKCTIDSASVDIVNCL